jgi:hypothetical protein
LLFRFFSQIGQRHLVDIRTRHSMRLPLLLISLMILSNATLLPAQVYKWVDNEGETHYGDKPQSNAAETVHIKKSYT